MEITGKFILIFTLAIKPLYIMTKEQKHIRKYHHFDMAYLYYQFLVELQ